MKGKYKFKDDLNAKQYIGIHLKWNYIKRHGQCSMKGYIKQALEELKHIFIAKHHYASSIIEQPDYQAKMKYVKEDNASTLSAVQIKHIKRVVENFLYYGGTIDITMLHALNNIASTKNKGIQTT